MSSSRPMPGGGRPGGGSRNFRPGMGQPRVYRWLGGCGARGGPEDIAAGPGAATFVVREEQTDLWVSISPPVDATNAASSCQKRVRAARRAIMMYAREKPLFLTSLRPLAADPARAADAPLIVHAMLEAGLRAGVGPMAAVAGAIAEDAARFLRNRYSGETVIVENGGDVYAFSPAPLTVMVLAGSSAISGRAALRIPAAPGGISVCTSSGTVGPSFSRGRADAATVVAADGALADALATGLGNRVRRAGDIEPALAWLAAREGALGGAVVVGGQMGLWGQLELVPGGSGPRSWLA